MKKVFSIFFMAFFLSACSNDLSEYYTRLEQQEAANRSLQQNNAKQEQQNADQRNKNNQIRLEGEELRRKLLELEQSLVVVRDPQLLSMDFYKSENPKLVSNIKC